MTILVTNDDGDSEGLRILLGVANKFDNAYAIIPNRQRSAVSGALTMHKPIRLHRIESNIHSINGTPSDCVLFSIFSKEFPKPNLVLSGINWGDNAGIDCLLGSGTIAACWQAALEGIPGIAFSLAKKERNWHKEGWGEKEKIAGTVEKIIKTLKPKLKPETFFNVNLPTDLENAKIVYMQKMQRDRFGVAVEKRIDPYGNPYFWISGILKKTEKGTDVHEVIENRNIVISEIPLSIFEKP
ncbi:5'-nucleotidase SurE1 [Candidatus Bilamarchaeum dharawalense]|uniref:5'-nucleotidase SurE1 n=1 Tax=Candidatus Bilamarchaeum dharawalense TaxID=2885759 RepID=A0A5E4LNF9_9ARCH|nr:5'-nucleotidase SurE1 [Candidatus Bilamarchaeum dharawalense]